MNPTDDRAPCPFLHPLAHPTRNALGKQPTCPFLHPLAHPTRNALGKQPRGMPCAGGGRRLPRRPLEPLVGGYPQGCDASGRSTRGPAPRNPGPGRRHRPSARRPPRRSARDLLRPRAFLRSSGEPRARRGGPCRSGRVGARASPDDGAPGLSGSGCRRQVFSHARDVGPLRAAEGARRHLDGARL